VRWWIAALALLLVARTATAQSIAIEVYIGDPAAGSARRLAPILNVLAERGLAVGADGVGLLIEDKLSLPGRTGPVDVRQLVKALDEGAELWRKGEFATAAKTLEPPVQTLRANPALIVRNISLRESLFQGLLHWTRSLSRVGNPHRAREVMADLIRRYPDRPITEHDYGPAAEMVYVDAIEGLGLGRLAIRVDDPEVDIYVDGRLYGTGGSTKSLLAGPHQVYVQKGTRIGRLHDVQVYANEIALLEVDWMLDACLYTSASGGVGLRYASRAERDEWMVKHILRLGELLSAPTVIAFQPGEIGGLPALLGTTYDVVAGKARRNGGVVVATDPAVDDLEGFAAYLVGDAPIPALHLLEPIPPEYRSGSVEQTRSRHAWVKWTTGGAAVALGGASVYLFSIDGKGTCGAAGGGLCRQYHEVTAGKWSTAAGALALAAVTVWLFVDDPWERAPTPEIGVAVIDSTTMVTIGGRF